MCCGSVLRRGREKRKRTDSDRTTPPGERDRISHRAPRLLWQQVHDDVLGEIRSGVLAVDDRLPSEFEMAEQYGVSRDVIRRAKEELAGQGWLIVLQGRGTFVAHGEPGDGS
jgi:DNA-binding GntR family transcriptional regulator